MVARIVVFITVIYSPLFVNGTAKIQKNSEKTVDAVTDNPPCEE